MAVRLIAHSVRAVTNDARKRIGIAYYVLFYARAPKRANVCDGPTRNILPPPKQTCISWQTSFRAQCVIPPKLIEIFLRAHTLW